PPDARIATGNQRFATNETTRAAIARFAVVWPWIHVARKSGPGLGLFLERRLRILRLRIFHGKLTATGVALALTYFLRQCRTCASCRYADPNTSDRRPRQMALDSFSSVGYSGIKGGNGQRPIWLLN